MAYKPFIKLANDEMVELPLCAEKIGTETIGSTSEPVYIDQGKPKSCSALKTMMLDFIYPIGSYFITESSSYNTTTKVANHFGGTWVRVTGRFLYDNNGTAGQTGGSNDATLVSHSHTVTINSNGSHNHSLRSNEHYNANVQGLGRDGGQYGIGGISGGSGYTYYSTNHDGYNWVQSSGSHSHTNTVSSEGNSATNANMPAYRTVYMYRRTA